MKFKSMLALSALLFIQTVVADITTENKETIQALCPFNELTEPAQSKLDRLSIEKVLLNWESAVQVVDLTQLGSLVAVDAEFWTHGAAPLVGRDALIEVFETFLSKYEMQQKYDCQELVISGNWAFIRGHEVNQLKDRETGEVTISKQRAFSVLSKSADGQWRFSRGMTNRPPEG